MNQCMRELSPKFTRQGGYPNFAQSQHGTKAVPNKKQKHCVFFFWRFTETTFLRSSAEKDEQWFPRTDWNCSQPHNAKKCTKGAHLCGKMIFTRHNASTYELFMKTKKPCAECELNMCLFYGMWANKTWAKDFNKFYTIHVSFHKSRNDKSAWDSVKHEDDPESGSGTNEFFLSWGGHGQILPFDSPSVVVTAMHDERQQDLWGVHKGHPHRLKNPGQIGTHCSDGSNTNFSSTLVLIEKQHSKEIEEPFCRLHSCIPQSRKANTRLFLRCSFVFVIFFHFWF